jgi:hypothetical protein
VGAVAGYNRRASSVQTNPNKTKQKSLDFLGFVRPNRDFSKGYERKIKKIDSRLRLCAKRLKPLHMLLSIPRSLSSLDAGGGPRSGHQKIVVLISVNGKLFRWLLVWFKLGLTDGSDSIRGRGVFGAASCDRGLERGATKRRRVGERAIAASERRLAGSGR